MGSVRTLRPAEAAEPSDPAPARVRSLTSRAGDAALVQATLRGDRHAFGELFDRHGPHVRRVLQRVLGPDQDLADLLQEVFVAALRDLRKLEDADAISGWLVGIAVHLARRRIRTRTRWRWLLPTAPQDLPEVAVPGPDGAASEQLRASYALLTELPADERIAFCLRFVEGMELTEVAAACDVSLATAKRRLRRAEDAFRAAAAQHPALRERIARSGGAGT